MTLLAAKTFLTTDRMDWHKPHLPWVAETFYRRFNPFYSKSRDD